MKIKPLSDEQKKIASYKWTVVSDGACSGNPGPGGYGVIVVSPDGIVREMGDGDPATTNNRMELLGSINGLKYVFENSAAGSAQNIQLVSDSSYVLEGFKSRVVRWSNSGWKTSAGSDVLNRDLWEQVLLLLEKQKQSGSKITYTLVPGHAGIACNDRVDEIAVAYSRSASVSLYSGPIEKYSVSLDLTPFSPIYISIVNGQLTKHKTWPECQKATVGVKGAKFKKVTSNAEMQDILKEHSIKD